MNLNKIYTNRGFSLLELLLALSVITTLIIASTHFFTVVNDNYKVNQALDSIKQIRKAAAEYCLNQPDYATCLPNDSQDLQSAITKLYDAGLLPQNIGRNKGAGASPWGTDISISTSSTQIQIILSCPIPAGACTSLQHALQNQTSTPPQCISLPRCGGTFIASFS